MDDILYPPMKSPYMNGTLKVSSIHTMSYSLWGKDGGRPALFLHGGPGAGSFPNHARFFDPDYYQIVLYDQRGCGKSSPKGEYQENTLYDLMNDIEALRMHLGVHQWDIILGGSFGTTLAVSYAEFFPQCIRKGLVLRGFCLMRSVEINWLFGDSGGASRLCPKEFDEFKNYTKQQEYPGEDRLENPYDQTILRSYYNRMLSGDPMTRLNAAMGFFKWESSVNKYSQKLIEENAKNFPPSCQMIVWDGKRWTFRDENDEEVVTNNSSDQQCFISADSFVETLKRFTTDEIHQRSFKQGERTLNVCEELSPPLQIQPIIDPENITSSMTNMSSSSSSLPIPAQPMLTCYYSINNSPKNQVFGFDLLQKSNLEKLGQTDIKIIHGAFDTICPIDTCLEFLQSFYEIEELQNGAVTSNIEVRVPLKAGHSMYQLPIAKEIIRATNSFREI